MTARRSERAVRFWTLALAVLAWGCAAPGVPTPGRPEALPPAARPASDAEDLAACIPASVRALDADIDVTARADDGDGEVVLLEWHTRDVSPFRIAADFHPILLRLAGGACESLLPEQSDAFSLGEFVSEPVLQELLLENTEWKARRVGGVAAYQGFLEEAYGGALVACPARSDELGVCVDADSARALRAVGVAVAEPAR